MENSNPSNQETVGEQLIEDISQLECLALGEGVAVCEACGEELREGAPVVVFAFRPVEQPTFELGHVKCTECRHEPTEFFTLGGARNFGAGIVDAEVVNPLYSNAELRRVYNRAQDATSGMDTKDDLWRDQCRAEFVRALQARTAAHDGDVPVPGGESA